MSVVAVLGNVIDQMNPEVYTAWHGTHPTPKTADLTLASGKTGGQRTAASCRDRDKP